MANDDWRPVIRVLLYGVQFDPDPLGSVDRIIERVVEGSALGLRRKDYRQAIVSALASAEPLAALLPQRHTEETVRAFLVALRDRL